MADEIGNRDRVPLEPGKPWPVGLAEALRTTPVFVYLHSPTWFNRVSCWQGMASLQSHACRRTRHLQIGCVTGATTANFLAQDSEVAPKRLRKEVSELQYSHEDYGETYNVEGLRHLPVIGRK